MKILLIEDDRKAAKYVINGLTDDGHVLDHAPSGTVGLELACTCDYDVAVVDRMLHRLGGLLVVRAPRSSGRQTPSRS